ncbi:MAG: carboxypeptidase regulatory-like domain-containing protein, partial [Pyrinomonadaceae bacterium]
MYRAIIFLAVLVTAQSIFGQTDNTVTITVKNHDTNKAVPDTRVTLKDTGNSKVTDANGRVELTGVPDGEQTFEIFSPGYETRELKLTFPLTGVAERTVTLELTNEVGEVTIT